MIENRLQRAFLHLSKIQRQHRQPSIDVVVQVTGDPPTIFFLRRQKLPGQRSQLFSILWLPFLACSMASLARSDCSVSLRSAVGDQGLVESRQLLFFHRRRAEDELRQAHDEIEVRVHARTQQLATLNQSLITEIADRKETEQSLRASEAALQARERQLQQNREELRALAGQLLTAQEEDRRRISRDLHDDINQRLAMLSMDLRSWRKVRPVIWSLFGMRFDECPKA